MIRASPPKKVKEINNFVLNFLVPIFGYAAKPISRQSAGKGGTLACDPEGFHVRESEGPLEDGELERAVEWGHRLISGPHCWGSPLSLTITVGLSLFILIVWANSTDSLLPVLATCLRIDPAVISGPVMSTLVDASRLFVCFILAHLIITKSQQNKGNQKRI